MNYALIITISLLVFSGSVQAAKIINFQPNCKADHVENIELIRQLLSANGTVQIDTKESLHRRMLLELVELAKEKQVEAVILNDIKVMLPDSKKTGKLAVNRFRMKMVAEFVNLCKYDKSLSKSVTPFNNEGNRQMELGGLTFEQQQIVIKEPGTEQREIPALQSATISLVKGIYGVMLGFSKEQTLNIFGHPTAEFKLDDTTQLLAYGRSHWFYFKNSELVKVTSENLHLNRNLINLIPFDDRFYDAQWQLYQHHTKNTKKSELDLSKQKTRNEAGQQLLPVWRKNNAQEDVLDGFDYSSNAFIEPELTFLPQTTNYTWLTSLLDKDSAEAQSELDRLTDNAIGKIYLDRITISYVIDEYMLLSLDNGKLREITIGDKLFKSSAAFALRQTAVSQKKTDSAKQSQWKLGNILQESAFETVQSKTAGNGFHMGDTLTISHPNYNLKYQFYEQKNQLRLFQLHFSVF